MTTEVKGLPEFLKALNKISDSLPDALSKAAEQAARFWVDAARSATSTPYEVQVSEAFTINVEDGAATIRNDDPLFYGTEFGGGSRPETQQFPPYQGKRGYFFYPTARAHTGDFDEIWQKAIDQATEAWDHKE